MKAVRRQNWEPSSHSVLCSEHILKVCFQRPSGIRAIILCKHVVPSVFPGLTPAIVNHL